MSKPFTEDRAVDAFTALGELLGHAKMHGMTEADAARLSKLITPVLHRGSKVRHLKAHQMRRRVGAFPRDDAGRFVKRTTEVALPF